MFRRLRPFAHRPLTRCLWEHAPRRPQLLLGVLPATGVAYCGASWLYGCSNKRCLHCEAPKPKRQELPDAKMFRFRFCGKPEKFTPVYEASPRGNTASLNAGDYKLHVGGGAISLAFAKELKLAEPNGYAELHRAMLEAAHKAPGKLQHSSDPEAAVLKELGLLGCFSRAPVGSSRDQGPVGSVFISVFKPEIRPLSEANVAMVYTVGPRGVGAKGPSGPSVEDPVEFLAAMEEMAANIMLALREYNKHAAELAEDGIRCDLPTIEVLHFCLVSGGVYRHPKTSKNDVAKALVRGLVIGSSRKQAGSPQFIPVVKFAYDEGAFENAVQDVIFTEPNPDDPSAYY